MTTNPTFRPRPVGLNPRGFANGRVSAVAVFAMLCWLFLLSIDTIFRNYIPGVSILRLGVPALLVVIACLSGQAVRRTRTVSLWVALFAFIAVSVLSVATSLSPALAAAKLALYLGVMLPLLHPGIASRFSADSKSLWWLTLLALVLLVANLLMLVRSSAGLMTNPNQAGLFVTVTMPLMLFNASLPIRSRKRLGRLGVIASLFLVVATRSRGAMLAVLVTCFAFYAFRPSGSRKARITIALMTGLVVIVFLLTTGQSEIHEAVYKGGGDTLADLVDEPRRLMFEEVIEAWLQRPLLAYGFGLSHRVTAESLNTVLQTGRLSWLTGEMGSSTLGFLIGGGVQLVVALYALIACILWRGYSHLADERAPATSRAMVRALLAGLLGLLVSAQSEAWLNAPMTFANFAFWLYCGVILYTVDQYNFQSKLHQANSRNQERNV